MRHNENEPVLGKEEAQGRNYFQGQKMEKIYSPCQIPLFFEHDLQE